VGKSFAVPDAPKSETTRRPDITGLLLLAGLAVLAVGVGAALLEFEIFTPWKFGLFLFVCLAFVVVGLPTHGVPAPKNAKVHGAAAPASEQDALAAARGKTKPSPLHDQQFPD
jgi:hypothetical protein